MSASLLPVFIMGASSVLLQISCLRRLLSEFSGNELDIGITLAVWLAAVGLGSHLFRKSARRNAFGFSFLAVGLLAQPAVISTGLIRDALRLAPGETIPLLYAVSGTFLCLTPLCLAAGAQFPLAVRWTGKGAGLVYGIEAAGAFTGGALFTFLISGHADSLTLTSAISVINLASAFLLLKRKVLLPLIALPVLFFYTGSQSEELRHREAGELVRKTESRYGEIAVFQARGQYNVYSSGKLQFAYPDAQAEEPRAHLPMLVHPSPVRVLLAGGSPGVARELLKYGGASVDYTETDPEMIRVSMSLLSPADKDALGDGRCRIILKDARSFIKGLAAPEYDLVIVNLPEPATANINRFYTVEFFREAAKALKTNGVLSLSVPSSFGYIGRRMQVANGSVFHSLKEVFPHVAVSSEEYGYLFASDRPIDIRPEILSERFAARQIRTASFTTSQIRDAFSPLKVSMVTGRLGTISATNTDMRPVSYLYNLMLWAEVHGGRLLLFALGLGEWQIAALLAVFFLAAAGFSLTAQRKVFFPVFTTGYATMAFSIVIILAWQAAYGHVYEMIGLLTASFMSGLAAGPLIMRAQWCSMRTLRRTEAALLLLFLSSGLLLRYGAAFFILNFICGFLAGLQFSAAGRFLERRGLTKGQTEMAASSGRLYAVDLAGSFLGCLLAAVLLVPLLGMQNLLMSLVFLKVLSLGVLLTLRQGG